MAGKLLDIHCQSCGGAARYDILKHSYTCKFCGNETPIKAALEEKKGFRTLVQAKLKNEKKGLQAEMAKCPSCGATVVFPENDVIETCSFCRKEMVREEFSEMPDFPELIIPFKITYDEAKELIEKWYKKNSSSPVAKKVKSSLKDLQGYYLPFELVRGPIDCIASREGASLSLECGGELENTFINTSKQLDNITLDGMEPFDLDELEEFNYGFIARQKAKVSDISEQYLAMRVKEEVAHSYQKNVAKVMETKNIEINVDPNMLMKMPLLLPVYYINMGNSYLAVNGQTGKISVSEIKTKKQSPWWIKPIIASLVVFVIAVGVITLFTKDFEKGIWFGGMFDLVMAAIFFTAYHNAYGSARKKITVHDLKTSDEIYERGSDNKLVISNKKIKKNPVEPIFFYNINGEKTRVFIKFTSSFRLLKMLAIAIGTVFLPAILAFVLNGFSSKGLSLVGAAVWFCISVPLAVAFLVSMGRIDIYENPYVYTVDDNGGKHKVKLESNTTTVFDIITALKYFKVAAVFIILCLVMSTYLVLHP